MCIDIQRVNNLVALANNSNIDQKKKLCAGIAKYLILKGMYEQNRINEGFINLFYDFYGLMRQEDYVDRNALMAIIQTRNANESVINVMRQISRNGHNQFSYATKVLHTIDNNLPIYDSRVADFTERRSKTEATYNTLRNAYANRAGNWLNLLVNEYDIIVGNPICHNFISYGNIDFTPAQAMAITEVKKIDFMIWVFWED